MPMLDLREETTLPADGYAGALAARVWSAETNGPSVVAIREKGVFDVSAAFPTMRDLCETPSPAQALRAAEGPRLGALSDILAHTPRDSGGSNTTRFLAPIDLQAIKAAGVTFAVKVQPRAKRNAITGAVGNALKLALTAPPIEGRANQACIEFFANLLDVSRSSVTIASGETSRHKIIRVAGLSANEVRMRIEM